MKIRKLITSTIIALMLAGSVASPASAMSLKELLGTALGGALGGYGGSKIGSGKGQLAATAGGAVLGAFLGNSIGSSLEKADQLSAQKSTYQALEYNRVGQASSWNNTDTSKQTYGNAMPTRTYRLSSGQYCREYQQDITVGGQLQRAYGTACRQRDGSWKIVNSRSTPYQQRQSTYQQPSYQQPSYQQPSYQQYGNNYNSTPQRNCQKIWVKPYYQRDGRYIQGHYEERCY